MRKKLALAAALLHNPPVLFLDEPFEAVDPVSARTIRDVLASFTARGGTVVLSSHVMELVERLCDSVAVMAHGRVLAAGPTDELRGGRPLEEVFVELVGGGAVDGPASARLAGLALTTGQTTAPVGTARLVRTAVRLRVALLRGALRGGPGSTGRRLGLAVGAVAGVAVSGAVLAVLVATAGPGRLAEDLVVLLFNALLLGWLVLPVLTFAGDDLLDPTRLALLPLRRRQLMTVMGAGALVGVAPVATLVAASGLLPATGDGPLSLLVGLLAVGLLLVLCVTASRAVAASLSGLLRSRRGRDVGVALVALLVVGVQLLNPALQLAARSGGPGQDALAGLAAPLRWTPAGLLATAPDRGPFGALAALSAVALLVTLVVAWWGRSVARSLERPDAVGSRRRRSTALAPRGVPLPSGRAGAVAAKDLRYVLREPRRLVAAATSVLVPVLAVGLGPLLLVGGPLPRALVFAACGVGLLGGFVGSNRFGMDGSATWLLLSTATDERDARRDLLGGDVAVAVVTVPVVVLSAVGLAALTGGWSVLAPALGCALALLAVAVAASGVVAVRAPFPVPVSSNAFSSGSAGQGCATGLLTLVCLGGVVLACLPLLLLLVPALRSAGPFWGLLLLVVGPAYGAAVGEAVRRASARAWASGAPEVLQVVAAEG